MERQFGSRRSDPSLNREVGNASNFAHANQTYTVPSSVKRWAIETPDAPALVQSERTISFAELDSLANTIAANLRIEGVLPNVPVGIYIEGSIEFVAAAFGVSKAGGAYLPIDPAYPVGRATYILSDSGAAAVITRSGLAERLNSGPWKTLVMEDLEPVDVAEAASISSEDLAYLIYTSFDRTAKGS